MANIRVERRKKPVWPWILGLLLLCIVGLVLFTLFRNGDMGQQTAELKDKAKSYKNKVENKVDGIKSDNKAQNEQMTDTTNLRSAEANQQPQEVNEFVSFANNAEVNEGETKEFAAEGLNKLTAALESVSNQSGINSPRLDQSVEALKNRTQSLQQDTSGLAIAPVREALGQAADAFEAIQTQGYPMVKEDVNELKSLVKEMSTAEPLNQQKEDIKEFFAKSAEAFENMEHGSPEAM